MSTNNALNNSSSSFSVTTNGLTVNSGTTTLTPLASTAATGVVTINNAGVLAEVETGGSGTIFVGTATAPKFLAAGTANYVLQTNGAGSDPTWVSNSGGVTGQTNHAVEVGAAGGGIASLSDVGETGQTLMGNTGANPSWTGSPSFSGSVTAGSGDVTVTSGNINLPTTSSSGGKINIGGSTFMHAYGSSGCFSGNLFIGFGSGNFTNTATSSTAIGSNSMSSLVAGGSNVGIGSGVMQNMTTAYNNTGVGYNCLNLLTTAGGVGGNSAIGVSSLGRITTGAYNTAAGYQAGYNYTGSESSNICIGYGVTGTTGESNVLRIGNGTGTGPGQLNAAYICGITGITVTGSAVYVSSSNQLGVLASSARFKENIHDMGNDSSDLYKLRPVTFNYKEGEDKSKQYGLIAEEVAKVYPELISYDKDGAPFTVYYHVLPAMLLNEIQKLHKRIIELEAELEN